MKATTIKHKRELIAVLRKCKRWMSDPEHRVRNWEALTEPTLYEDDVTQEGQAIRYPHQGERCRTCIVAAPYRFAPVRIAEEVSQTLFSANPQHSFIYAPYDSNAITAIYDRAIKFVENKGHRS